MKDLVDELREIERIWARECGTDYELYTDEDLLNEVPGDGDDDDE